MDNIDRKFNWHYNHIHWNNFRYEFLSLSGHYRHPDPGAKSAVPTEASPALHLLTDTDDERSVSNDY